MAGFLQDPATHGGAETRRIDTHTAAVILAGDRAYKLRRPVDYGFLNYAPVERRWASARREVEENARTAPGLYLGISALSEEGDGWTLGAPVLDGTGTGEPVVVMHRFPDEALFDRMVAQGRVDTALMRATGRAVAAMHRTAKQVPCPNRLPDFAVNEATQLTELAETLGPETAAVAAMIREQGARLDPLAASRPCRRCHGDLHLRNIVMWRDTPSPFDCIDFNDAISDIDPLYDVAFLLMDLEYRGHPEHAVTVLNAWAEGMAAEPGPLIDIAYGGLALLPFYRACRAAIRAKVDALAVPRAAPDAAEALQAEAQQYLALAKRLLDAPPAPRLLAVGGLSGSGKSTLAGALAVDLGAVVLRSDAIRKGFWGVEDETRLPPEAYQGAVTERVYQAMLERAEKALAGGMPVILDAAHLRAPERDAAEALALKAAVPFHGLWLEAPVETLQARVAARKGDVSDATPDIVARQTTYELGEIRWHRLQAADTPEATAKAALAQIQD